MKGHPENRYIELITERCVEKFLLRLFLRKTDIKTLCIISPFISTLSTSRFTLKDLRKKIEVENIPTYLITLEPIESYQKEAVNELLGCPWIEIRYNPHIHAKTYILLSSRERDSFALLGSGNFTTKSFENNIEIGMMIYAKGVGNILFHELYYWASVKLRTLPDSKLIQKITHLRS
jgi:hypothetical protein